MNIGIIGAGNFSIKHIYAIQQIPGLTVKSVSRRSIKELEKIKNTFGVAGYSDYRYIIDDPDIQIVLIATPHHLHADIAEEAAANGKHLMVEKPLASTWTDCMRIYHAVKANNVFLMPAHIGRFTPAFLAVRKYLEINDLGTIISAKATSFSLWKNEERQAWHLKKSNGGGYLLTLGVHQIDLLCALISSRVVKVYAKLQNSFHGDEVDDCGSVVLEFANGTVANLQMAGYQVGSPLVETKVFFERGMVNVSFSQGVHYYQAENWVLLKGSRYDDWMQRALINEWGSFKRALQGKDEVLISLDEAMHVMEIIFAIFRSSFLGRAVDLPLSNFQKINQ